MWLALAEQHKQIPTQRLGHDIGHIPLLFFF